MKIKTKILILLLLLFVIPTSTVFACDNSSEKEKTEKASYSLKDDNIKIKSCCDKDENDDGSCGGACDHKSCHCPRIINCSVSFSDVELTNSNNYKLLADEWTYVQIQPKAVYLSIWQLPKIS